MLLFAKICYITDVFNVYQDEVFSDITGFLIKTL